MYSWDNYAKEVIPLMCEVILNQDGSILFRGYDGNEIVYRETPQDDVMIELELVDYKEHDPYVEYGGES